MKYPGVYQAQKKDGTIYYRSSITYKGKHISLGSCSSANQAHQLYQDADTILHSTLTIDDLSEHSFALSFDKLVSLINYRENNIYIKNPIFMRKKIFNYYLDDKTPLIFDIDDLFYYSTHKIQKRGNYLFVYDYGMQINILSRYGIKNYSTPGIDYIHANQNELDYTYNNIEVINPYYGVSSIQKKGRTIYKSKIHLLGTYLIGYFNDEITAAIAYNKAVDIVNKNGCSKTFQTNYIPSLSGSEYAKRYSKIVIPKKIESWREMH